MSRLSAPAAVALIALGLSTRLGAQAPEASSGSPAPSIAAAPLSGGIHLDGVLDEAAWGAATPVTQLTQRDPDEGAADGADRNHGDK
ncbi:MAG: hypothetical protein ACREMO_08255 [Gemmatimonadales bacterium]